MNLNEDLPEEDEDDDIPEDLLDRWSRRDVQYMGRTASKFGPLTLNEIAAIRAWREAESEDIDDKVLAREARRWMPPL